MVTCSIQGKCQPPFKVCQKCTDGYVDGEDGISFLKKDFEYKCHLCAGTTCPVRARLHHHDGVDEMVVKVYILEKACKRERYGADDSPSTFDHAQVIQNNPYDDHFRVIFDTRRVCSYGDFLQYMKVKQQDMLIPIVTKIFFWHSKLMTYYPFTEPTFDTMVESSRMPDGSRQSVHMYVLVPCDIIDYGATERARLHGRRPFCQNCLTDLADDVDDLVVLCGNAECLAAHPEAIHMLSGPGVPRVDDVTAGGDAAVPSSPMPGPADESLDVDFGGTPPGSPATGPHDMDITPASEESNARVQESQELVEARRQFEVAMQQLHARDVVGVLQYLESNLPTFATPLWGFPRNLHIEPLSVEELRSMTRQMDVTQLRSFAAARAASREMPKAKPAPRPAGRGTLQPGMLRALGVDTDPALPEAERHARAKVKAKAKSHQGAAGSASDQAYSTTDTADTGARLDGTPITPAVQLNMLHQMTNIMGALAGEEDPAGRTASAIAQARGQADDVEEPTGVTRRTPQNQQMSAEEIAAATRLTGERLGDLMHQSSISEERLAELNRHFGDPGPHEPGHED